jgi:methionine synthase II (cobalamin-independent)
MSAFQPRLQALQIGSLPYLDPDRACALVLQHVADIPSWPQLPRRAFQENMYAQFSERFPGIVLEPSRIWCDRDRDLDPELTRLYASYLDDDVSYGETSAEYALGLHAFAQRVSGQAQKPAIVKGQITGPISWGLTVVDQNRRPVLYDEILCDAVAKHLRLKACWQEAFLRRICDSVIISIDEPFMSSFGSAYVSLSREMAISLLEEVLGGLHGLKMVHCCGNTDWSLLLATSTQLLSFDAYDYAANLALYPAEIEAFLARGGILAWGITPNSPAVWSETVDSLVERLLAAMGLLVHKGFHLDDILAASVISPTCGLGSLSEELAERILTLTGEVSQAMCARYL